MQLTIQIFLHGQWHDAATLDIPHPEQGRGGPAQLGYDQDYALQWLGRDDEHACSLTLPVELMWNHSSPTWFALLDDIMPAGAARRYWVNQLGLAHAAAAQQDFPLLQQGTIAPVGNLRIKESLPTLPAGSRLVTRRFPLWEVLERNSDFLEYAQQMGAASGGATGAGGEAPKLLLRCSAQDEVWIDTFQNDLVTPDAHYLVKFPRGQRSADDCDILRAEYHYYHELAALGVGTIATDGMRLLEGSRFPSLWLPRFDVAFVDGQLVRYGLESVYAVLGKPPGSYLNHFDTLRQLLTSLRRQYRVAEQGADFDEAAFVIEWVKRDMLNVVFGNSDNHGRNMALLKKPDGIWLSPVYDFAPMRADPDGVTRSTTWGAPFEEGGRFDWHAIAQALADVVVPVRLLAELGQLALQLSGLPQRLATRGVPPRILTMPVMGFDYLDDKLQSWKLP